jgi:hypothetical protein
VIGPFLLSRPILGVSDLLLSLIRWLTTIFYRYQDQGADLYLHEIEIEIEQDSNQSDHLSLSDHEIIVHLRCRNLLPWVVVRWFCVGYLTLKGECDKNNQ